MEARCKHLLREDNSVLMLNFSSSSANDPGDDPVRELDVSDCDLRRARVGEGDDSFRSSLFAFLLGSLLAESEAGKDFLRFFECRLIITFRLLLDECLFLEEAHELNGEHVIFNSALSSQADEYSGLLEVDGDEWRKEGTVSIVEAKFRPLLEVAITKYRLNINQTITKRWLKKCSNHKKKH